MPRLLLAVTLALVLAAPAQAGKITYGSDLSQPANLTDNNPNDWAAWPTATTPASAGGYTVTQQGEVTQVTLKGTIPKPPNDAAYQGKYPGFVFDIEVLRPQPDGKVQFVVATEALPFPFGGDPQQLTTFNLLNYQARICAQPGDVVAIATSGGFGGMPQGFPDDYFAQGYPVQMFSRVPTSSYGVFKQVDDNNQHANGIVPASSQQGRELLMRVTVGTGADARYTCRTKAEQAAEPPQSERRPDAHAVGPPRPGSRR